MEALLPTLNQMACLMLLIAFGYLLTRKRLIPSDGATVLSKFENDLFIPALILDTFTRYCTRDRLSEASGYFLAGWVLLVVSIPLSVLLARLLVRDAMERRIYTYGLAFSNFGFMGNAIVASLFPHMLMEYLVFVLPLWIGIYAWGVPSLLMVRRPGRQDLRGYARRFINPMFIATLAGICIGIWAIPLPGFISKTISCLSACMSPVSMILTGIILAGTSPLAVLKRKTPYIITLLRLILLPLLGMATCALIQVPNGIKLCVICALAMPLGLNMIIIPSADGQDTTQPAGAILISHLISCVTIPVLFSLIQY